MSTAKWEYLDMARQILTEVHVRWYLRGQRQGVGTSSSRLVSLCPEDEQGGVGAL